MPATQSALLAATVVIIVVVVFAAYASTSKAEAAAAHCKHKAHRDKMTSVYGHSFSTLPHAPVSY
jgi:hypothetical protein